MISKPPYPRNHQFFFSPDAILSRNSGFAGNFPTAAVLDCVSSVDIFEYMDLFWIYPAPFNSGKLRLTNGWEKTTNQILWNILWVCPPSP